MKSINRCLCGVWFTAAALLLPAAQAVSWDVSLWGKRRAFTEHVEKLSELVAQKTNGEFVLNISYGGLSKNKENLDGIAAGAFEMAQFCAGYHEDKNPSITVLELPFLGVTSLEEELAVSRAVYASPIAKKDLARWNATLLMPSPLPQYNIAGDGDVPTSVAELRGLPVRATGGIGEALKRVGLQPVSLPAGEVYNAMESGTIHGAAFAPHAHLAFRTIYLADWWTKNLNPGTVNCPVVVNTEALNALSPAHRQALLGSVDESLTYYLAQYKKTTQQFHQVRKAEGIAVIELSADDLTTLRQTATPVLEAWRADMQKKGIDGDALLALVKKTLGK